MVGRFSVRPAGALDLDAASRFHADAFEPLGERPWTRRDVAELLASPGVAGFFIQHDGRDIGFVLVRIVADEAELLTIAVAREHRRFGAGRALLERTIEHARSGGAQSLFLEVDAGNRPARELYAQLGFRAVGQRPAYYQRREGPPSDALVMRLVLTSGG
jgi:ribosomal-protein-alanine N-acetyltransferase